MTKNTIVEYWPYITRATIQILKRGFSSNNFHDWALPENDIALAMTCLPFMEKARLIIAKDDSKDLLIDKNVAWFMLKAGLNTSACKFGFLVALLAEGMYFPGLKNMQTLWEESELKFEGDDLLHVQWCLMFAVLENCECLPLKSNGEFLSHEMFFRLVEKHKQEFLDNQKRYFMGEYNLWINLVKTVSEKDFSPTKLWSYIYTGLLLNPSKEAEFFFRGIQETLRNKYINDSNYSDVLIDRAFEAFKPRSDQVLIESENDSMAFDQSTYTTPPLPDIIKSVARRYMRKKLMHDDTIEHLSGGEHGFDPEVKNWTTFLNGKISKEYEHYTRDWGFEMAAVAALWKGRLHLFQASELCEGSQLELVEYAPFFWQTQDPEFNSGDYKLVQLLFRGRRNKETDLLQNPPEFVLKMPLYQKHRNSRSENLCDGTSKPVLPAGPMHSEHGEFIRTFADRAILYCGPGEMVFWCWCWRWLLSEAIYSNLDDEPEMDHATQSEPGVIDKEFFAEKDSLNDIWSVSYNNIGHYFSDTEREFLETIEQSQQDATNSNVDDEYKEFLDTALGIGQTPGGWNGEKRRSIDNINNLKTEERWLYLGLIDRAEDQSNKNFIIRPPFIYLMEYLRYLQHGPKKLKKYKELDWNIFSKHSIGCEPGTQIHLQALKNLDRFFRKVAQIVLYDCYSIAKPTKSGLTIGQLLNTLHSACRFPIIPYFYIQALGKRNSITHAVVSIWNSATAGGFEFNIDDSVSNESDILFAIIACQPLPMIMKRGLNSHEKSYPTLADIRYDFIFSANELMRMLELARLVEAASLPLIDFGIYGGLLASEKIIDVISSYSHEVANSTNFLFKQLVKPIGDPFAIASSENRIDPSWDSSIGSIDLIDSATLNLAEEEWGFCASMSAFRALEQQMTVWAGGRGCISIFASKYPKQPLEEVMASLVDLARQLRAFHWIRSNAVNSRNSVIGLREDFKVEMGRLAKVTFSRMPRGIYLCWDKDEKEKTSPVAKRQAAFVRAILASVSNAIKHASEEETVKISVSLTANRNPAIITIHVENGFEKPVKPTSGGTKPVLDICMKDFESLFARVTQFGPVRKRHNLKPAKNRSADYINCWITAFELPIDVSWLDLKDYFSETSKI